jgi:cysteamine dioxygenase
MEINLLALEKLSTPDLETMINELIKEDFSKLTVADLGITAPSLPSGPSDRWVYFPIAEEREFTLAVFGLRKGQKLPLHDHPEMTVFMKPLFGTLRIRSFACNEHLVITNTIQQIAKFPEIIEIGTNTPNIHEIPAEDDCAFADIVFPPYTIFGQRAITYFQVSQSGTRLEKIPMTSDNKSVLVTKWQ